MLLSTFFNIKPLKKDNYRQKQLLHCKIPSTVRVLTRRTKDTWIKDKDTWITAIMKVPISQDSQQTVAIKRIQKQSQSHKHSSLTENQSNKAQVQGISASSRVRSKVINRKSRKQRKTKNQENKSRDRGNGIKIQVRNNGNHWRARGE